MVLWSKRSKNLKCDCYGRSYKDRGDRITHPRYKAPLLQGNLEYRQVDIVFSCGADVISARRLLLSRDANDERWLLEPRYMQFPVQLELEMDPNQEASAIIASRLADGWEKVSEVRDIVSSGIA
ncbi:MAG: hypothetical protein HYR90_01700 [Candidatus Andersenbacteria bacterium]|nr:hypothetical protein [Candidatus Andersenbacteria bacterium]